MKKYIVEQVRGRPKYLHIALNFQSDFPNLLNLHAIFSRSQGPPAPGFERQENPWLGHSKTNVHFMSLLSFEAKNKTVLSFKANCLFPTFN